MASSGNDEKMISVKISGTKFNYRLGAVVVSSDKKRVLLHTIEGYGFYLLPGGRLELMETAQQGIARELEEELGLVNIKPKHVATVENFFVFNGTKFHEISENFFVQLDQTHEKYEEEIRIYGLEGDKYIYDWFDIEDLDSVTMKPPLLRDVIRQRSPASKRYFLDER